MATLKGLYLSLLSLPSYKSGSTKYDNIAQMLIKNNTSDEQMVHINQNDAGIATEMWCSLHTVHEVCGQSAVTVTKYTFYSMQAMNEHSIPDHIADMPCQAVGLCNLSHDYQCLLSK